MEERKFGVKVLSGKKFVRLGKGGEYFNIFEVGGDGIREGRN